MKCFVYVLIQNFQIEGFKLSKRTPISRFPGLNCHNFNNNEIISYSTLNQSSTLIVFGEPVKGNHCQFQNNRRRAHFLWSKCISEWLLWLFQRVFLCFHCWWVCLDYTKLVGRIFQYATNGCQFSKFLFVIIVFYIVRLKKF